MSDVVAGWYPDPAERFEARFHNGSDWTADVSRNGQRYVDPLGTAPPQSTSAPHGSGGNRAATAAMVLGIVALATSWMPFVVVIGAIAALLALILATLGLRQSSVSGTGRSFALTGLITGAIALVASVVGVLLSVVVLNAIDRYENPAQNAASVTSCELNEGSATMQGEITNLASGTEDFSVKVAFVRPGTNNAQYSTRIAVDGVAPGETRTFEVNRPVTLDEIDCAISDVDGPLPFGLEID
jgi:hypothetical protein